MSSITSQVTRHSSLSPCPVFIGGEWRTLSDVATSPVFNPSRGDTIAEAPMCGANVVNEAVEAAANAFPAWRDTPPVERARLFFRYR
ncbi:MAG: aldehyde dehydrogenase family protein, partial [Verrucomicrobiota bacterium]|nr:aldehyde dehydrogenase family protein [Verrucomicrobiota bacterium]